MNPAEQIQHKMNEDEETITHLKKELEAKDEKISDMRDGLLEAIERIEQIRYGWSFLEIHLVKRLRELL